MSFRLIAFSALATEILLFAAMIVVPYGSITQLNKFDVLFLDSTPSFIADVLSTSGQSYVSLASDKQARLATELYGLSNNIILHATKKGNQPYFNNPFPAGNNFQLWQAINDQTSVTVSNNSMGLAAMLPAYLVDLWGHKSETSATPAKISEPLSANQALGLNNSILSYQELLNGVILPYGNLSSSSTGTFIASDNLLTNNTNFNNGPWEAVKDCKDRGVGNVTLQTGPVPGVKAAQVTNDPQIRSCLGAIYRPTLSRDTYYQLSFDYEATAGDNLQFYYNIGSTGVDGKFTGTQHFVSDHVISSGQWHRYQYTFKISQANANELDLFFFADPASYPQSTVRYTNVSLQKYSLLTAAKQIKPEILPDNVELNSAVSVATGKSDITFTKHDNLLSGNVGFESGGWPAVKDCVGIDQGVELHKDSNHGNYIQVQAPEKDKTCTSKAFSVDLTSDKQYKLSFDYKNVSGNKLQFYYNLNSATGSTENFQYFVRDKSAGKGWQTYSITFKTPNVDIKEFDIFFYATSNPTEKNTNQYDNISLQPDSPKDASDYFLQAASANSGGMPNRVPLEATKNFGDSHAAVSVPPDNFILESSNLYGINALISSRDGVMKKYLIDVPSMLFMHTARGSERVVLNGNQNAFLIHTLEFCKAENSCLLDKNGKVTQAKVTIIDLHALAISLGIYTLLISCSFQILIALKKRNSN